MAIQQVLTVYINLKGDGASSTFSFALQNLYQFSNGIAVPFGGAGVVPTAVSANNPPVPVTSVVTDANGNITLTTTSALPASVFTFQLDLTFTSGASSSASPTQTTNVAVNGAVTTGAPTYITGQTSPLSLDTSGNLRVSGSFSAGALPDLVTAISLTTATPGAGNTTQAALAGRTAASFELTGTWTGTIAAEGTVDGTNWFALDVWSEFLETWVVGNITVNGRWWFEPVGALSAVRVRANTLTSGTVTGTLLVDSVPMGTFEFQGSAGQTFPPNQIAIGGTDGTNMRALSTDTLGHLNIVAPPSNPLVVQAGHTATANTSTALANAFASNVTAGNSLIVIVGVGSGTAPTSITDTLNTIATVGNTYKLLTSISNGATFSTYIYMLAGTLGGANTVTVNTASSTVSSIIYEVSGLLNIRVSDTGGLTGTSAQAAISALYPTEPGEIIFQAIAIGTASQTITVGSGFTGLAQINSSGGAAGLFTLGAQYQINPSLGGVTPVATFTSEPWASCAVSFYAAPTVVGRTVNLNSPSSSPQTALTPSVFVVSATTPTLVAAGAHNLYGMIVQNLLTTITSTGTQYVRFYDSATAAGAAAANYKFTVVLTSPPAAGTSGILSMPPGALALANFTQGIVVSIGTTSASTTTTGAASSVGTFWYQ